MKGCKFIDLDIPEIHFYHTKLDEKDKQIDDITLRRMGLDNFVYYCKKWNLPTALAEDLALRCGIIKPSQYVDDKVRQLDDSPRYF